MIGLKWFCFMFLGTQQILVKKSEKKRATAIDFKLFFSQIIERILFNNLHKKVENSLYL